MKYEIKAKNYIPQSISFAEGFLGPKGNVGFLMVADYKKAEQIVNDILSDGAEIDNVVMGLDGDFECNSSTIYKDGKFHNYEAHESSQWAEPIIIINFRDRPSEAYSCYSKEEL